MRISDWSSDVCSSDLGEVGEVEQDEETDDDARPAHRSAGYSGGLPVARLLVATSVGPPVHAGEAVGRVDVQHERHDDALAEEPEAPGAGEEEREQLAEELAVVAARLDRQSTLLHSSH